MQPYVYCVGGTLWCAVNCCFGSNMQRSRMRRLMHRYLYPCDVPHISRITAGASFGSIPLDCRNAS